VSATSLCSDDPAVRTAPVLGGAVAVQGDGAFYSSPTPRASSGVSGRAGAVRGGPPALTSLSRRQPSRLRPLARSLTVTMWADDSRASRWHAPLRPRAS
jgi:hypothetical protein